MVIGTLQCPGGHLEYGESFAECAKREVLEETGLDVDNFEFLAATNDIFGTGKHYVTILLICTIVGINREPKVWNFPFFFIDRGIGWLTDTVAART